MSEPTLLDVLTSNEPYMLTSRSGRVLQVAPSLTEMLGADPTGRNLNDLMDDGAVSKLILHVTEEEIYTLDCEIGSCFCTCGARLSADGRMILVFKLLRDHRDQSENLNLIHYLTSQINQSVGDVDAALRLMNSEDPEARADGSGLLNKSLDNLLRISRNAAAVADFGKDGTPMIPRPGDLTDTLVSVCRRAAEVAAPYHDITVECDLDPVKCVFDATAVQRVVLDLIHHALSHSPLPRARLLLRITRSGDQLTLQVQMTGSAAHSYAPQLGPGGVPVYGSELELSVASILLHSLRGKLVNLDSDKGGWLCRAVFPIVPAAEGQRFSNMIIDWYGGRDPVLVELSGVLPSEVYRSAR